MAVATPAVSYGNGEKNIDAMPYRMEYRESVCRKCMEVKST
jgi:hypothetical protein